MLLTYVQLYVWASDISHSRGATKFTKTHKVPQNSVDILSNTCLYNIFETYLSYWGCLLAVNLQIYLETSLLKCANNVLKLTSTDYVAENWALAMMLKALLLVRFWRVLLLKEQMMTFVRKTFKTLALSAQNRSICSEICPQNNHKIGRFLPIAFWWNLPWKFPQNWPIFPQICPWNSRQIWHFFHDLSEALLCWIRFGTKVAQHLKQA